MPPAASQAPPPPAASQPPPPYAASTSQHEPDSDQLEVASPIINPGGPDSPPPFLPSVTVPTSASPSPAQVDLIKQTRQSPKPPMDALSAMPPYMASSLSNSYASRAPMTSSAQSLAKGFKGLAPHMLTGGRDYMAAASSLAQAQDHYMSSLGGLPPRMPSFPHEAAWLPPYTTSGHMAGLDYALGALPPRPDCPEDVLQRLGQLPLSRGAGGGGGGGGGGAPECPEDMFQRLEAQFAATSRGGLGDHGGSQGAMGPRDPTNGAPLADVPSLRHPLYPYKEGSDCR